MTPDVNSTTSLRICRIALYLPPMVGGYQFHVQALTRWLSGRGHDTLLYTLEGEMEGIPRVRLCKVGPRFIAGTTTHYLLYSGSMNIGVLCRFSEIRQFRPHLVHAHGDYLEALAASWLGRMLGIPSVLTVHAAINEKPFHRWLARRIFEKLERLIVVSEALRMDLVSLGIHPEKIQVISSGVDIASFERSELSGFRGGEGAPIKILSVGRLHPMKGYDYLIQAVALVQQMGVPIECTIVGDGPEEAPLRSLAERLLTKVNFTGRLSPSQVRNELKNADLFVLPSVSLGAQAEGTPTALIEAMAAGLPVVSTDSGGIRFLVKDGRNGFVVPERSPDALARAMSAFHGQPEMALRFGEVNYQQAKSRDWSAVGARVEQVYRDILGGKGSPRRNGK